MRIKESETPFLSHQQDQESSCNEESLDYCETPGNKKIGKWTAEEDDLLRKYVPLYGEKQWRKISNHIKGRTSIQCLHRWTKILKPGLVKGPWTAEEDQKLINWVKREGPTKWAQASNFIVGRSGKQCRERWFNNLNPNVKKGNWSKEEDELIFELYQKNGSSWSKIAKFIPGRTENAIKNRFYSTLRRLAADKKKIKDENVNEEFHQNEEVEEIDNLQTCTEAEIASMNVPANTLYKLLQEKTGDQNEQIVKESSFMENKASIGMNIQKKYINNKKGFMQNFDNEIIPEQIMKISATVDKGDEDDDFEKFLLGIDNTVDNDFLMKEFEEEKEENSNEEFENLQEKILKYCQTNISTLADAFKTITHNPLSVKYKNDQKQITQNPSSYLAMPQKGDFYQNTHGISILTPNPQHNIDGKKSFHQNEEGHGPGHTVFNSQAQIAFPSNMDQVENSYDDTDYLQNNLNHFNGERRDEHLEKWNNNNNNKWESARRTQDANLNHLLNTANSIETQNGGESEKKLTFLFQQLYSLEDLLKNAKNELMKLESNFSKDKRKDIEYLNEMNKENTLNEEKFKDLYEKDLWTPNVGFMNEGVEQIVKKRKYSP